MRLYHLETELDQQNVHDQKTGECKWGLSTSVFHNTISILHKDNLEITGEWHSYLILIEISTLFKSQSHTTDYQ